MMEVNNSDPRIGTILNDRYKIIDRIAAGGMAVVYRGERVELGRPVAIKFLQELMLQNPKFITRFESEARAMSKLSHPYCVSVIDFGVEVAPYIVMDYVEGITLKALIAKEKLSVSRAITLTRQILAGIAHAHSQGIVHRDIKPENIMLQEATGVGEQVRIFDFGLAKILDSAAAAALSHSSLVAGTPNYMSPEQSRGGKIDERTDLYSISVLFFELLTGRKPFIHDDFLEVVRMHREAVPPSINDVIEERIFSEELQDLVAKALSKDPDRRFQSAEKFSAALDATPEGVRAKEHEASIRPDPKAKTLPVGTMTPFENLPFKRPSIGPTRALRADDKKDDAKKEEETVVPEEPRAEKQAPPKKRGGMKMLVSAILVAAAVAFFAWPEDGPEERSDSAKSAEKENGSSKTPAEKKAASKIEKAGANTEKKRAGETAAEAPDEVMVIEPVPEPKAAGKTESTPPQFVVKSIADAKALLKEGKKEAAISGLQKLRREQPRRASIVFMLANLYYEKNWLQDALEHYREAIRLDKDYRKRTVLIRNLIGMMSADKIGRKAMSVLHRNVGKPALPALRRASKRDKNPTVRRRAAAVIKKIRGS